MSDRSADEPEFDAAIENQCTAITRAAKNVQSRQWMIRCDAPTWLTEEDLLDAFGEKCRVIGRVMMSERSTEDHPCGYRHLHAVIQDRKKAPIRQSTIWNAIRKMLRWKDSEHDGKQPSIYSDKPRHGINHAIDYSVKAEKTDEHGNVLEKALQARRFRRIRSDRHHR